MNFFIFFLSKNIVIFQDLQPVDMTLETREGLAQRGRALIFKSFRIALKQPNSHELLSMFLVEHKNEK